MKQVLLALGYLLTGFATIVLFAPLFDDTVKFEPLMVKGLLAGILLLALGKLLDEESERTRLFSFLMAVSFSFWLIGAFLGHLLHLTSTVGGHTAIKAIGGTYAVSAVFGLAVFLRVLKNVSDKQVGMSAGLILGGLTVLIASEFALPMIYHDCRVPPGLLPKALPWASAFCGLMFGLANSRR